ncbi:MAG: PIN domain-containing protein [Betaproteobacteria bacterium]|nr:PIN domain-containing protein [Betaproteobacteria bacterium]MBU6513525.1 PIN domain-containing protein [Betaproteobacteria bacterium]MDE1957180.1 PIN domain-containing protein [Betaproteobacteria bacterium]MDE2153566.1 PIN domain-containing protein [Betaproteobacteria bacterium]MDE2477847.1 PIN domain-containing protein [Betaproteobacteria bacterium]
MSDVLVDTSVWVEHFRRGSATLAALLDSDRVLIHPMVLGELGCGTPPDRARTLAALASLRPARVAGLAEVGAFAERERLYGQGFGLVDMTLLASTLITPGALLWTLDTRLARLAREFGALHHTAGR